MKKVTRWMGKHKGLIVVLLIAAVIVARLLTRKADPYAAFAQTQAERRDFVNYNSFVGNVQASSEYDVLAKVSDEVLALYVSNGDTVKAGDILAILDAESAEYNIALKEAALAATQASNEYSIQDAQRNYNNYEEILSMTGIVKTYRMGDETSVVLKGIDLSVRQGEFLAVLGPSGSGKSTLMNIIGCLDVPTEGDYYLHGQHIADQSEKAPARNASRLNPIDALRAD